MTSWPKHILHIDDDPMILQLVKTIFERSGQNFIIESCDKISKTQEVLKIFQPDLILLDINMPDLKTDNILAGILENSKISATPIIFVTGYADIPANILSGKNDFPILGIIQKPCSPTTFLKEIKILWDKKHNP